MVAASRQVAAQPARALEPLLGSYWRTASPWGGGVHMPWKLPILRGDAKHGPVAAENAMKLRVGYELQYAFPQPTPVILMLNIHFTRVSDW
jgi:hypothetical protein